MLTLLQIVGMTDELGMNSKDGFSIAHRTRFCIVDETVATCLINLGPRRLRLSNV